MSLDFSKLTDAVAKVAALAASHGDASAAISAATSARDAALADLAQAQIDINAMADQLIAAAQTPAESAGLAAVASALVAPAPVGPASVTPAVAPVAPHAPVAGPSSAVTYLPGDPRAPKA